MPRGVPARELIYDYLKERELGEAVSWKEISEAAEVDNAERSHRNSVNWAKERLAETHGKTLSPPTSGGFIMVPLSLRDEKVFWPGECTKCALQGVPKGQSCKHGKEES